MEQFIKENFDGGVALMDRLGLSDRKHFAATFLRPALDLGLVEMSQPDKPNSSRQRYRLTELGHRRK